MAVIKKKTWPKDFELIKSKNKRFEFRLADFKVREGDTLILEEWDPKKKKYTGRKIRRKVKFFLKFNLNDFGQKRELEKKGFYIMQF